MASKISAKTICAHSGRDVEKHVPATHFRNYCAPRPSVEHDKLVTLYPMASFT